MSLAAPSTTSGSPPLSLLAWCQIDAARSRFWRRADAPRVGPVSVKVREIAATMPLVERATTAKPMLRSRQPPHEPLRAAGRVGAHHHLPGHRVGVVPGPMPRSCRANRERCYPPYSTTSTAARNASDSRWPTPPWRPFSTANSPPCWCGCQYPCRSTRREISRPGCRRTAHTGRQLMANPTEGSAVFEPIPLPARD
jgi:hypothetical protein